MKVKILSRIAKMKVKVYISNKLAAEFSSDTVPRVNEFVKFGKTRYRVWNVIYRMKSDGTGFLHARINLG